MRASDLIAYIDDPAKLESSAVEQLQQLANDFPYFQSAHILLTIAAKRFNASVYQQSLKRTAITVSNREHLFDLIHRGSLEDNQLKTETAAKSTAPVAGKTEPIEQKPAEEQVQKREEGSELKSNKELDILKETELEAESIQNTPAIPELFEQPAEPEKIFAQEIAKQVVASYIEKEVLKTPELHKPAPVAEDKPESFGDWLMFLKKNNGQSYSQIKDDVSGQKEKDAKARQQLQTSDVASEKQLTDEEQRQELRKQKNKAIMDKVIERNPGLIRTKEEQKFFTPEVKAKESLLETEHLMTETLARIYALQGNVNKAVRAYEILSLKYPQKSAYFATLIQQLKNNQ